MHHHLENDPVWNQHNKQLLLQSRCNYFITLQASSAAYLLSPVLSHMHPPATREMVASPISQHTGVRCDWLGAVFTTTSTSRPSPPPPPPLLKAHTALLSGPVFSQCSLGKQLQTRCDFHRSALLPRRDAAYLRQSHDFTGSQNGPRGSPGRERERER